MAEISEDIKIAEVERRLTIAYAHFPPSEISEIVRSARQRFDRSPVRDFVPLFVERNAGARLAKLDRLAHPQVVVS